MTPWRDDLRDALHTLGNLLQPEIARAYLANCEVGEPWDGWWLLHMQGREALSQMMFPDGKGRELVQAVEDAVAAIRANNDLANNDTYVDYQGS